MGGGGGCLLDATQLGVSETSARVYVGAASITSRTPKRGLLEGVILRVPLLWPCLING